MLIMMMDRNKGHTNCMVWPVLYCCSCMNTGANYIEVAFMQDTHTFLTTRRVQCLGLVFCSIIRDKMVFATSYNDCGGVGDGDGGNGDGDVDGVGDGGGDFVCIFPRWSR